MINKALAFSAVLLVASMNAADPVWAEPGTSGGNTKPPPARKVGKDEGSAKIKRLIHQDDDLRKPTERPGNETGGGNTSPPGAPSTDPDPSTGGGVNRK